MFLSLPPYVLFTGSIYSVWGQSWLFKLYSCNFLIFCAFYQIYSALLSVRASSFPSPSFELPFFLQNQIRTHVNHVPCQRVQCQSLSLPGEKAQIMTYRAGCDNLCVNWVLPSLQGEKLNYFFDRLDQDRKGERFQKDLQVFLKIFTLYVVL